MLETPLLNIECALRERSGQWSRNPESVGYGSLGKQLKTQGLRGILLRLSRW